MKTAWTGSLTVLAAAALLSATVAADSISTIYNMDRMLSEPHPLANQYGTRWQPALTAPVLAPRLPSLILTPPQTPTPSPFPATAPEPPPTTFPPPIPPPLGETAAPQPSPPQPAPQPAPLPQPVAKVTPVEPLAAPMPVMAPKLSIDTEGVDLKPEKTEPAAMEKEMEQPGPRPPLSPG